MDVDGVRVENLTLYGRVGGFEQVAQDPGEALQKVSRDNTVIYINNGFHLAQFRSNFFLDISVQGGKVQ